MYAPDGYFKSIIVMSSKDELLRKAIARYPAFEPRRLAAIANIHRVSKEWDGYTNSRLEPHKLSLGKLYALIHLVSEETDGRDAVSPSEIATALDVARPTVTALVDGLERDGYVSRTMSADRRTVHVHLTDKARTFLDAFVPTHSALLATLLGGLTVDEQHQLIVLLSKIDVDKVAISFSGKSPRAFCRQSRNLRKNSRASPLQTLTLARFLWKCPSAIALKPLTPARHIGYNYLPAALLCPGLGL